MSKPALQDEITSYGFLQSYAEGLLQSVTADNAWERVGGANGLNPAWILGHLATVGANLTAMLGGTPSIDPKVWGERFGGGTDPTDDAAGGPSWDEIVKAWRDGHASVAAAHAAGVDTAALAGENPVEMLKEGLPTLGEFISFALTAHESLHLGQLSAWRRARGEKPLF